MTPGEIVLHYKSSLYLFYYISFKVYFNFFQLKWKNLLSRLLYFYSSILEILKI